MKLYGILITEILERTVWVMEDSFDAAENKAQELHKEEIIVLDSEDFNGNTLVESHDDFTIAILDKIKFIKDGNILEGKVTGFISSEDEEELYDVCKVHTKYNEVLDVPISKIIFNINN